MSETTETVEIDEVWDDTALAVLTATEAADASGDTGLAFLESLEPGIVLAAALAAVDVTRVSGHDRIIVLRAHHRMASHYQARSYHDMASVPGDLIDEGETSSEYADEAAAAEIRAALRLTRRAADSELSFALELQRRLPTVWDALAAGMIDVRRAKSIIYGTLHLPVATALTVVDEILDEAPRLTTGQIAARVRKLCIQADPDDATNRYRNAVDDRRVVMEPTTSGTANLLGLDLPPHKVAAATQHVNRLAQTLRTPGEARTIDQLRADVLLDLLCGATTQTSTGKSNRSGNAKSTGRGAGGGRGRGVGKGPGVVDIRVDLTTLAGLSDHPGELAGYGPVIADIARQVTDQQTTSEWRWTVTHPDTGMPLTSGTTRRRPTTKQRREVETRDTTCVFPGCRMPATTCDLDHQQPWNQNGPTQVDNLAPLCRHDHQLKTIHGWHHQTLPDGDYQWTTPLGHTYRTSSQPP